MQDPSGAFASIGSALLIGKVLYEFFKARALVPRQRAENNETLHVKDTKESLKLESMPPETAAAAVAPRPQIPAATQSAHHGLQALAAAATDAAAVDAEREAAAVASARSQTAAPAATVRPAAVTGPARHATAAATAPVARANPLQIRISERVTPAALIRRAVVKQEVVTKAEAAVAVKVEPSSTTTALLPSQQVFQHVDILSHIYTFIGPGEWVFNGVISTYCRDALLKNNSAQLPTDSDQTAVNATTKRTTYAALLASIPRLRSLLENPTMCAQLMLHTSKPTLSFIAGKVASQRVIMWMLRLQNLLYSNTTSNLALCIDVPLSQEIMWDQHAVARQAAKFNHVNILQYIRGSLPSKDKIHMINQIFDERVSCSAARNGSLDVLM
eukprot:8736-Heterococcus_DN1.PRE.4